MTAPHVGDPLPALMSDADLMAVVGLKVSRFQQLKKAGRFDAFKVRDGILNTTRYSGALVRRWLDGNGAALTQAQGKRQRASR